jgi:hypothetical protein
MHPTSVVFQGELGPWYQLELGGIGGEFGVADPILGVMVGESEGGEPDFECLLDERGWLL